MQSHTFLLRLSLAFVVSKIGGNKALEPSLDTDSRRDSLEDRLVGLLEGFGTNQIMRKTERIALTTSPSNAMWPRCPATLIVEVIAIR
jgi:hypothetical protein